MSAQVVGQEAVNVSCIIKQAETYVRGEIEKAKNDSSHDWWHIVRVRNLAVALAKEEVWPAHHVPTCILRYAYV
eukprot:3846974-Pyramimonas_sp.AAC.1